MAAATCNLFYFALFCAYRGVLQLPVARDAWAVRESLDGMSPLPMSCPGQSATGNSKDRAMGGKADLQHPGLKNRCLNVV